MDTPAAGAAGGLTAAASQGPPLTDGEVSVQLLVVARPLLQLLVTHHPVAAVRVLGVRVTRHRPAPVRVTDVADRPTRQDTDGVCANAALPVTFLPMLRPFVSQFKPATLMGREASPRAPVLRTAVRIVCQAVHRLHLTVWERRRPAVAVCDLPVGGAQSADTLAGFGPHLSPAADHHLTVLVEFSAAVRSLVRPQSCLTAQRRQQQDGQRPDGHRAASAGASYRTARRYGTETDRWAQPRHRLAER